MITGSLQIKNNKYCAVLNLYENGERKPRWIPTGLDVRGNKRTAETFLRTAQSRYEEEYAARNDILKCARMVFNDFLENWLTLVKPTIEPSTYNSYRSMIDARILKFFSGKTIDAISHKDIKEFHQSILSDGFKTNTVI